MEGRQSGKTLSITNQTTNALKNTLASEFNVMSSAKIKSNQEARRRRKTRRNKIIPLKRNH